MRELSPIQLVDKRLLSPVAQCYHLVFEFSQAPPAPALPGQFFSFVATDPSGKQYTRAYSIASSPATSQFDLCVNRVEGGFFSNLLCDLEPGATLHCHGPHGLFTLEPAARTHFLIAESTGIAPFRSFLQALYPAAEPGVETHLLYNASSPEELFYDEEFRALAATQPSFRYTPVLAAPSDYALLLAALPAPLPERPAQTYVCGLGTMVRAVRQQLKDLGWERRHTLFERYD